MTLYRKFNTLLASVALCLGLASCSNWIYEDEGDCDVHYRLAFRYDYNLKFADAFAQEVTSVKVYAFDATDRLVWSGEESGSQLAADGFSIELPLDPGKYRLVAWCGLDNGAGDDEHFKASDMSIGDSQPHHLSVALQHKSDQGLAYSDNNLYNLYHGSLEVDLDDFSTIGGTYTYTMPLQKDTNKVTIVLQNLSGSDLNADDYIFAITDQNGTMDHKGDLASDLSIEYRPWNTFEATAGVDISGDIIVNNVDGSVVTRSTDGDPASRAITQVRIAGAELTVARLMEAQRNKSILTITSALDGHTVARLPLIDYALLVKGSDAKRPMSNQEYLDRQDQYHMVLFMDDRGEWVSSTIIVNSWRVVFQNDILGN